MKKNNSLLYFLIFSIVLISYFAFLDFKEVKEARESVVVDDLMSIEDVEKYKLECKTFDYEHFANNSNKLINKPFKFTTTVAFKQWQSTKACEYIIKIPLVKNKNSFGYASLIIPNCGVDYKTDDEIFVYGQAINVVKFQGAFAPQFQSVSTEIYAQNSAKN